MAIVGTPIAGTWCIREVGTNLHTPAQSLSSYGSTPSSGARPQILGAMNVGCFVGFGLRLGWDHIETGRISVTGLGSPGTLLVATNHPAVTSGTPLSFSIASSPNTAVNVVVTANAAANSSSIQVSSTGGISAGCRAGIYDDSVLNLCYSDIQPLGYLFAPRIMNGKYTPANLAVDGSPTHTDGNGTYHEPYNSAGTPNPILILALTQLYRHIFAWADTKNAVHPGSIPAIMAGTIPGMDYAELYFSGSLAGGDYLAQLHGGSTATNKARMVTANNALMDSLVVESAGRYTVGFGISGLGSLDDVIAPGIALHAASFGAFNNAVYVNANGWAPNGEWGSTVEASFDTNVWPKQSKRGVQDISPTAARTAANWITMFNSHALGLPTRDASWTEIYAYQVRAANGTGIGIANMNANQAAWDEMVNQSNLFNTASFDPGPTDQTVTVGLLSNTPQLFAPDVDQEFPQTITAPVISVAPIAFGHTFLQETNVVAPFLDLSGSLFAPKANQKTTPALLDQSAVLFAPKANRSLTFSLISVTPQLFGPTGGGAQRVTLDSAFQNDAFQNDAFQASGTFIDRSGTLFAPSLTQVVTVPAPSAGGAAFQSDAFQGDTFQSIDGTDRSPTLFAPTALQSAGGQTVVGSLIDRSGTLFAPSWTLQVTPAIIDQHGTTFAPGNTPIVSFGGSVSWDSPDVLWDTAGVVWDESGAGSGILDQSGQLFAPAATFSIKPSLIDQSGVVYAPSAGARTLTAPLISVAPILFVHQANMALSTALIDQTGVLFAPERFAQNEAVTPGVIDQSGVLFAFQLNARTLDVPLIDREPVIFAPMANESVAADIIDQAGVLYGPFVGPVVQAVLIDQEGVTFIPSLERVFADLIDQTAVIYEPERVNLPIPQTIRLDDGLFPDNTIDLSGQLYAPDVELAPARSIFVELLDQTGTPLEPRIYILVGTEPIRLVAEYNRVIELVADASEDLLMAGV